MDRVLVVDDEESVRQLLRDSLELDGYLVSEAADAMQAMARISEDPPQCVVLDVMMPGMSGIELLERLRNDPATAELPILMLTAASDDVTTWAGWANGASYYVPKPFDVDHLLDWVHRLCQPTHDDGVDDLADLDAHPATVAGQGLPAREQTTSTPGGELSGGPLEELSSIYEWSAVQPVAGWPQDHDGPQREELVRALDTGQIWVAYQPIVALGSGQVVGVEALARWEHPHRGDLAPAEFLPLAERAGLAGRLGAHILEEAAAQVRDWNAMRTGAGLAPLTLSVNVAASQVTSGDLVQVLRRSFEAGGLPAASVVLELGETALMRLLAADQRQVRDLLELGVSLAFDDFAAATTSLSFLQRFHVDVVKIDRRLVRGLGVDDAVDSTVAAVVSIAHRLGRAVVAEGVETMEQEEILRRLGCEYGQGFFFGYPGSAAQVARRVLA
jgi:EAL domain-containing protein (putative c-di-GMP-specific phosphodiesterase class I)/DNA-binding response OmpR family regulator